MKTRDHTKNAELHLQCKNYRNLLSTIFFKNKLEKIITRNTFNQIGIKPKYSEWY